MPGVWPASAQKTMKSRTATKAPKREKVATRSRARARRPGRRSTDHDRGEQRRGDREQADEQAEIDRAGEQPVDRPAKPVSPVAPIAAKQRAARSARGRDRGVAVRRRTCRPMSLIRPKPCWAIAARTSGASATRSTSICALSEARSCSQIRSAASLSIARPTTSSTSAEATVRSSTLLQAAHPRRAGSAPVRSPGSPSPARSTPRPRHRAPGRHRSRRRSAGPRGRHRRARSSPADRGDPAAGRRAVRQASRRV